MVKYRPILLFTGIMMVYFIIRYLRIVMPDANDFIRYYATDFLFVPAMSLFGLIIIRKIKKNPFLKLSALLILLQTVLISVYIEFYLPFLSKRSAEYTSDLVDIYMYFAGAIAFILIQKKWL